MRSLYTHTEDVHNLNAPREVVPLIVDLIKPKSIVDVGCGIGTWLKAFEENDVIDYIGVDGSYVNKDLLKISKSRFVEADLTADWYLTRRFDLLLCLEVAEHLPESCADKFVESLVKYSDVIIFSAALPGQGGQNHLNEQWTLYWQKKFAKHKFYFHDVIRPLIWDNKKVDWWYRQNIFLLSKQISTTKIINGYHPEFYNREMLLAKNQFQSVIDGKYGVWESFKIFLRAIRFKIS